jgi:hypothetical protein
MRHVLPLIALTLVLTACGKDPDARSTAGEGQLTAKAVADVDGAVADAQKTAPAPVQEPTAVETK